MQVPDGPAPGLQRIGTYRRRVAVPPERVFENAFDWEHLPWLHAQEFASIAHEASGPWGWRARVGLRPEARGELTIELLVNRAASAWVSRPVAAEGPAAEIWTWARPAPADAGAEADATDLEIAFYASEALAAHGEVLFREYRTLYERLWDQDEEMAWLRERRTARRKQRRPEGSASRLELGSLAALRPKLPLVVELDGRPFRLIEVDGEILVHAAWCPHWLGPLDRAPVVDGCVTCPWHGYRFDVRSGRSADGRKLRLPPAPELRIEAGSVVLVG